jgi:thymidylate synthase (FAD)
MEKSMKVNLISYTKPASHLEAQGVADLKEITAYCARVSNPTNQLNTGTADALIKYLAAHRHWSPFEMVNVCLEIETTRDIARQILRHRSFSFQEFSQRYANPTDLPFVHREARLQDNKNRQNSIDIDDPRLNNVWVGYQNAVYAEALKAYQWALKQGIAKEVARCVLPEGMTTSRLYMNGTIRSWCHYLEVRTGPETQKEHREIARACAVEIAKVFPQVFQFCASADGEQGC